MGFNNHQRHRRRTEKPRAGPNTETRLTCLSSAAALQVGGRRRTTRRCAPRRERADRAAQNRGAPARASATGQTPRAAGSSRPSARSTDSAAPSATWAPGAHLFRRADAPSSRPRSSGWTAPLTPAHWPARSTRAAVTPAAPGDAAAWAGSADGERGGGICGDGRGGRGRLAVSLSFARHARAKLAQRSDHGETANTSSYSTIR